MLQEQIQTTVWSTFQWGFWVLLQNNANNARKWLALLWWRCIRKVSQTTLPIVLGIRPPFCKNKVIPLHFQNKTKLSPLAEKIQSYKTMHHLSHMACQPKPSTQLPTNWQWEILFCHILFSTYILETTLFQIHCSAMIWTAEPTLPTPQSI